MQVLFHNLLIVIISDMLYCVLVLMEVLVLCFNICLNAFLAVRVLISLFVVFQISNMSLYPSLEDMKVDQMGRVSFEIQKVSRMKEKME